MSRFERVRAIMMREYFARVRTRAFWISTALVPVIMTAFSVFPMLIASKQQGELRLGVLDATGRIRDPLKERLALVDEGELAERLYVEEIPAGTPNDIMSEMVATGAIDAYIVIDDEAIAKGEVVYRAKVTTNVMLQSDLEDLLSDVFAADRLQARGFDAEVVRELSRPAKLQAVDVAGDAGTGAGEARFAVAYVMFFLLYTMQIIYGQNVMRGVLEEKTSRVVEVIVSSVKPVELMVGKLIGIGSVALTQVLIWLFSFVVLTASPAVALLSSDITIPQLSANVVLHFIFYFIMGFFLYATLYAVIGAMHNTEQEAQQMTFFAALPVIIPVFFILPVISDPNSNLAVGLSLFPLFTPLLMTARVAVGAAKPLELAVADVLLIAAIALEIVLAARIYRVGILMYGKRPTIPELVRWARHR